MADDFSKRVVVITGASGGIGETVTRRWLETGASVVAVASSASSAAKLSGIGAATHGGVFMPVIADLTTADGAQIPFAAAVDRFGVPADTLVHLVGGFAFGAFEDDAAGDTWQRMMALNASSAYYALQAAIPGMRANGGGWIVALAARAALEPSPKMAAYAASKAALLSLVRSVSAEVVGDDIHVNAILTSIVDTPANRAAMGESKAADWVTADDIADATLYLCSEQAHAVHGATLEVYGRS